MKLTKNNIKMNTIGFVLTLLIVLLSVGLSALYMLNNIKGEFSMNILGLEVAYRKFNLTSHKSINENGFSTFNFVLSSLLISCIIYSSALIGGLISRTLRRGKLKVKN